MAFPGSFAARREADKSELLPEYADRIERRVVEWVEAVTTEFRGEQSTAEWLRSGLVLCRLVNKIVPGFVRESSDVSSSSMLENAWHFLEVARGFGLLQDELFSPWDLLDRTNTGRIVLCIQAFAEMVPFAVPLYRGPQLGDARVCDVFKVVTAVWARLCGVPPAPADLSVERRQAFTMSSRSSKDAKVVNDRFERFVEAKKCSLSSTAAWQARVCNDSTRGHPVLLDAATLAGIGEISGKVSLASPSCASDLDDASTASGSEQGDLGWMHTHDIPWMEGYVQYRQGDLFDIDI